MTDSKSLIKELQSRCAEGDAEAMRILGCMYMAGDSVDQNKPKARKLLTDAADAGDHEAVLELVKYYKGSKDPKEWVQFVEYWLRVAIIDGDDMALKELGDFYFLDEGNSNRKASLLYMEYLKKCPGDKTVLGYVNNMIESSWLDRGWKHYAELVGIAAENGNEKAMQCMLESDGSETEDDYDLDALLDDPFELPEVIYEEKEKTRRTFGRAPGKRSLKAELNSRAIKFIVSKDGTTYTIRNGEKFSDQMGAIKKMGYECKYYPVSNTWKCKEIKKDD